MTYDQLVAFIDDRLADSRAKFEHSLIDNHAPPEHLELLLEWNAERLLEWRRETLASIRARLLAPGGED